MIHELYRLLNLFAIVFFCLVLVAIQSVLLKLPMLNWLELDLLLLVVIYLSLHRPFIEGSILVAIIGRIAEIHSGAPVGILLTSYMAVFLTILFTKEVFLVATSFSSIILAVTGGVIWKVVFIFLAQRYGMLENVWRSSLEYMIPFLLSLGVFSQILFKAMRRLDQWTNWETEADSHELSGEDFL